MSSELAVPLTAIYNKCLLKTRWPQIWKTEIVVLIPKTQTPNTMKDIRHISMSPLWSKILESVVSELTLQEVAKNWKQNQHRGSKGSSTSHVLVEAWDCILRSLDRATDNKAVGFFGCRLLQIFFEMRSQADSRLIR